MVLIEYAPALKYLPPTVGKVAVLFATWQLFLRSFRKASSSQTFRQQIVARTVVFVYLVIIQYGSVRHLIPRVEIDGVNVVPGTFGALVCLLTLVAAARESAEGQSRTRLYLCLVAFSTNADTVAAAVVLVEIWIVSDILVMGLPGFFTVAGALFTGSLLTLAGLLAACFSTNWLWRRAWLNTYAMYLVGVYYSFDAHGKWYIALRHCGHRMKKCHDRFVKARIAIWEFFLGRAPGWVRGRPFEGRTRLEQFLHAQLLRCEDATNKFEERVRRDEGLKPETTIRDLDIIGRHADALLALADYKVCPYDHCPHRWTPESLWRFASRAERFRHIVPGRCHKEKTERKLAKLNVPKHLRDAATELFEIVRGRLEGYYKEIWKRSDESTRHVVSFPLALCMGKRLVDLGRYEWRHRLMDWLVPRKRISMAEGLMVGLFFAESTNRSDWDTILETTRLLSLRTDYRPTEKQHRMIADAWYELHKELPQCESGYRCYEMALKHYLLAKSVEDLQHLPLPDAESCYDDRKQEDATGTSDVARASA